MAPGFCNSLPRSHADGTACTPCPRDSDTEAKADYITVTALPPPPVAGFSSSPTSGTAPLTVDFTDLSTNSPTSWSWNFGGTGSSTAQDPSHEYTAAGSYTVSLTATNAAGSDTETKPDYITVTSGGMPVTIFADHFENGLAGCTVDSDARACTCESLGLHLINFRYDAWMYRTISTQGCADITVSCTLRCHDLDSGENYQVLWCDGSTWTVLYQIDPADPDHDGQWHDYQWSAPSGANNNPDFALKFQLNADYWDDYGYVDNLVVEGVQ